jgi:hypothetical protein
LLRRLLFGGGGGLGSGGSLSDWGSSSDQNWGAAVDGGVSADGSVDGSGSVGGLGGSVGNGGTLVLDVGDVAGVGVEDVVGDNLDAAVGKGDTVASVGGVSKGIEILSYMYVGR